MKNFKNKRKIFAKVFLFGVMFSISFLLTGCQKNMQMNNNQEMTEDNVKKSYFSFFGNDRVSENNNNVGEGLDKIDRYVKIKLESNLPEKVMEGTTFPIIAKIENYNYLNPTVIFSYLAGTSINSNDIVITYSIGGSSDLEITITSPGGITINKAKFVNEKIIPFYKVQNIANIKIRGGGTTSLLEKRLDFYFCYPVFKEDEFVLTVPGSNRGTGLETFINKKIEVYPNKGEIRYSIDAQGSVGSNNEYKYILTISAKKLGENNLDLAADGMQKCGPVPSTTTGKFPVSYFKIVDSSGSGITIRCEGANNDGIITLHYYNMNEATPVVCEITINRDVADKEYTFKIYSGYTLVKKIESSFQVISIK